MKPNRTRFLLLTAPLALGLGGSALGADMTVPMYKAPPPLAPAYSWTGWYAGINFGYGTGSSQGNYNVAVAGVPAASYGFNAMPGGGFAGLQGGYNYQIGSFVLGAETDLQGAGITDDRTCLLTCSNGLSTTFDQKLTWFGTTRARIGLRVRPGAPVYHCRRRLWGNQNRHYRRVRGFRFQHHDQFNDQVRLDLGHRCRSCTRRQLDRKGRIPLYQPRQYCCIERPGPGYSEFQYQTARTNCSRWH